MIVVFCVFGFVWFGRSRTALDGVFGHCSDEPYKVDSPKGDYKYFFNFCGHAKGCYQQPACQVLGPQPEAGTVQN